MPKSLIFILVLIALALVGAGVFWWHDSQKREGVVFINESPDLSEEAITEPLPVSEESVEEEIQSIEMEKEKALEPQVASSEPAPASPSQSSDAPPNITSRLIDWGYAPKSGRKIDTIVLHSSYNSLGGDEYSVEKIIAIYKDYGVGAHYLIDRKGKIYRLVEDKDIAYHAGASKMPDGRTNVNDFSLGIELINTMEDEYTKAQYNALNDLIQYLEGMYPIKHVVGHSDIAPARKTDPWNFDWKKLKI